MIKKLRFFLKNWEYWPWYMFYVPLVPYALYLAIKSKCFGFFSAVNPAIEGSGNGLESKFKTIKLIPNKYRPISIYIEKHTSFEELLLQLKATNLNFPIIVKPNIGFRGLLVKKIHSTNELKVYIEKYNAIQLIIQEYINYQNECGILYYKIPGEEKGTITSLTFKSYAHVVGDGKSSSLELVRKNDRTKRYENLLSKLNGSVLQTIPKLNEIVILNTIGNHCKGTQFINGNDFINRQLINFLDNLHSEIPGWNYGRIDLKYDSFNGLLKGENLKILEINGIISEPTHIYDASKGSYFSALKSIKNHWNIIYQIGVKNHKNYAISYTTLSDFLNFLTRFNNYTKQVKKLIEAN